MALLCQLENQLSSIFPLSTIPSNDFRYNSLGVNLVHFYMLLQAHNKAK